MNRGRRALTVVKSVPAACPVCRGDEQVQWRWIGATDATRPPCPHCTSGLPAIYLPWRTDIPRGGAA